MSQIHYFYKITNNINGKVYYGVHNTDDINDGYMGSGVAIKRAYNHYGIENFTKEILKYFNTSDDAFDYEEKYVTETLVNDPNCYNIKVGGYGKWPSKGKVVVYDGDKKVLISKEEYEYNKERYIPIKKGKVAVKDSEGNRYIVSVDDERYKNGDLVPINTGNKLSEEHKLNLSKAMKGRTVANGGIHREKKCWVYKIDENDEVINKSILLENLLDYLNDGWTKGRKTGTLCLPKDPSKWHASRNVGEKNGHYGTVYVTYYYDDKTFKSIRVSKEDLDKFLSEGWVKGRRVNKVNRNYMAGKEHYPSIIEVNEVYSYCHSWTKVAEHFSLTPKIIRLIRKKAGLM